MTEHLLDFPEEQKRLRRLRAFKKWTRISGALAVMLCMANMLFVLANIDSPVPIAGPTIYLPWKAIRGILLSTMGFILLLSAIFALLLGLIPVKPFRYRQRAWMLFVVVACCLEMFISILLILEHFWHLF